MKKLLLIFVLNFSFHFYCLPQGEIDNQDRIFYRNEISLGALINSNGYGIDYRFGDRENAFKHNLFEFGFAEKKHPKEIKTTNPYYTNSSNFIFGKLNHFYNLRVGRGKQKILYKKIDKGGITISRFYTYGLVLGMYKPIYYEVLYSFTTDVEKREEKFNSAIHQISDIYGKASYFKGFNEMKFSPGVYLKLGANFEFSKVDEIIQAIECGIVVEGFTRKIPIMATEENNQFFATLYLSFRIGKVIDKRYNLFDKRNLRLKRKDEINE